MRLRLVRNRFCEKCFSGSRRAVEQNPFWRIYSKAPENFRMPHRKLDHLAHLLHLLFKAANVLIRNSRDSAECVLHRLFFENELREIGDLYNAARICINHLVNKTRAKNADENAISLIERPSYKILFQYPVISGSNYANFLSGRENYPFCFGEFCLLHIHFFPKPDSRISPYEIVHSDYALALIFLARRPYDRRGSLCPYDFYNVT